VSCVPEVDFVPVQLPEAVQDVAFVELHVSVLLDPLLTDMGDADNETVGAGVDPPETVTVVLACAVRPLPLVHVSVYVAVAVNAPVLWLPERGFEPLHAPEAMHDAVRLLDHVNVLDAPELMVLGLAESVTVGRHCAYAGCSANNKPARASNANRSDVFMGGDHRHNARETVCLQTATMLGSNFPTRLPRDAIDAHLTRRIASST
jgi:hypothetical protein